MGIRHGFHQPVAGERLLVGVRGPQAAVAVRHLASNAGLDGVAGRVLLTELAGYPVASRHGWAPAVRPLAAVLTGGVGAAQRGLLEAVNDVLQGHIALEALQAPMVEGDDIAASGALKGSDGFEGFARGAAGDEDAVGTAETQAVGTRQKQRVFKQLQANWASQF